MNRKKILFLPKWYPHRFDPMPGLFVRYQAQAIAYENDVAVLYIHADTVFPQQKSPFIEQFDDKGVKTIIIYHKISKNKWISKFQNLGLLWHYHKLGLKLLKKQDFIPDIVHVHILTRLGIIALGIKKRYHIPYVISEHWSRYLQGNHNYKGLLRKWMTKWVVRESAAIIPASNLLKDAMLQHHLYHSNYQIVPNITDTNLFDISETSVFNAHQINLLHVSCFEDASKNISGILRVMKRLSNQRDDIVLRLVGDGIDWKRMVEYAKELQIFNKNVFFTGLLEGKPLAQYYQSADAMVIFSNYETFCMVVNESLACGVPVISTDTGCIAERVNATNGILIDPKNEEQLYQAILTIANRTNYYDKVQIRQTIVEKFSEKVVGKQLNHIYQTI